MPKPALDQPYVVALIDVQRTASMSEHMKVNREAKLGCDAGALNQLGQAIARERQPALGREDIFRCWHLLALQPAQGALLVAAQWMYAIIATFGPPYRYLRLAGIERDPVPFELADFADPQAMGECDQQ